METKRPFARIAGWAALWLSLSAVVLFLVSVLTRPMQAAMPAAYAMAFATLTALGVFGCVVASVLCAVVALFGIQSHGRQGLLAPAATGLTLAGIMLVPILIGMSSGFAEHSRLVRAREATPRSRPVPGTSTSTSTSQPPVAPTH